MVARGAIRRLAGHCCIEGCIDARCRMRRGAAAVDSEPGADEACRRHRAGHGHAARLRRRGRPGSACSRARAARSAIETFDVSDLACKIAGLIPRGDGTNGTFNPDQWMEPKEQRKVDDFIVYAMCAAQAGARAMPAGSRRRHDEQITHRRADRLRHRRHRGHRRDRDHAARARAAPGVAVLHSRPHHQSRVRLRLDRARPQGPEPRGGHRLLDRRARDRRCRRG